MISTLFSLFVALLALGFIIFIHELGHYWMARRCGMRVEAFGIGFGRPLLSFVRDGVQWNIGWLPFGGYVKIAGMEKEKGLDPSEIKDGFFGASPVSRILVALAGPLANVVLALILFSAVFIMGGREKPFSEVTNRIGWVDPDSELYLQGVRPGDIIMSYDSKPVRLSTDHLHAAMTAKDTLLVEGLKRTDKGYSPYKIPVRPYAYPKNSDAGLRVSGILAPANFLIWSPSTVQGSSAPQNPFLLKSGIKPEDRIVWVDGERIFSSYQLSSILNQPKVLVTVRRNGQILQIRVPKVSVAECKLGLEVRAEIDDWQWAAGLKNTKSSQLFILPYNLTAQSIVEAPLEFLDGSKPDTQLKAGDSILAVQGVPVTNATDLLKEIQKQHAVVIVERDSLNAQVSVKEASLLFDDESSSAAIQELAKQVGTGTQSSAGKYHLLLPIQLVSQDLPEGKKNWYLGLAGVHDLSVLFNPGPIETMEVAMTDMVRTLSALFGGYLSPKWLAGPVGMVQLIQKQTGTSMPEACFWVGMISFYLALSNLLPLPVLDGGYILLALGELVTGKRLSSKALEKLIMVFTIALIGLILFVTYHDIIRLISGWLTA